MSEPAAASPRLKAFVHLAYGFDVPSYARRHAEGQAPDLSPYGFHEAERFGFDVTFAEDRLSGWRDWLAARMRSRIRIDLVHTFANRRAIAAADVVWTMSEFEAMAVAALMALRVLPRRPIIGTAIWLIHWWGGLRGWERKLFGWLLGRLDMVAIHSQACLEQCRRILPSVRSELMYFGIAVDTFLAAPVHPDDGPVRIVAAGNDRTRDWDVILHAFGNDPAVDLVIVNQQLGDELLDQYSNLTIPRYPSMDQFRELYRSATYIAIPLHENLYSGLTVALEAMAIGVPVLATRTGGVPTYMAEDEALYVPVGDAAAWRSAVHAQTPAERRAMAERANARFRRQDYSTMGLMRQFAEASRAILSKRRRPARG